MSLCISIGAFGGFYFMRGTCWRVCLGWIAFTLYPHDDLDEQIWKEAAKEVLREIAARQLQEPR